VRFCLQRQDKENICRELGISHFIVDLVQSCKSFEALFPLCFSSQSPSRRSSVRPGRLSH
jgi:hypothetical protein